MVGLSVSADLPAVAVPLLASRLHAFQTIAEEANVAAPRVLILSSQTLFAESLASLLEDQGYQIVAVQPYDDVALARIAAEQPSVVVLDGFGAPSWAASALLECAADIRVVEVSVDNPTIASYHRRQSAATAHNFLELIANREMQAHGDSLEGDGDISGENSAKV